MATRKPRRIAPEAKLAAVEAAAEKHFAQRGYDAVSMADIAAEAEVAVGTVYRFFDDKAALLDAVRQRVEERFVSAMLAGWSSAEAFADRFAPMVTALFDEAERSREVTALLATRHGGEGGDAAGRAFVPVIADMYRQGVAADAYRASDPEIAAAMAYGMVEAAMRHAMAHGFAQTRGKAEAQLVAALNACFLRADASG